MCAIPRHDINVVGVESLWFEVILKHAVNIVLGVIYRPPPIESKWLDLFEQELRKCQVQNKNIIIMGDFNVNKFKDDCHEKELRLLMNTYSLNQLVTQPTRITSSSSTLIDHLYVSNTDCVREHFVSPLAISDHFPECLTWNKEFKAPSGGKHKTIEYRNMASLMLLNSGKNWLDLIYYLTKWYQITI